MIFPIWTIWKSSTTSIKVCARIRFTSVMSNTWSRKARSEEHTSELQSQSNLVCRLLLEKKKHTSDLHLQSNLECRPPLENVRGTSARDKRGTPFRVVYCMRLQSRASIEAVMTSSAWVLM